MNAHDRLRLYLEQRRELGESELVLDELPVEAVLKLIGAPLKNATARGSAVEAAPSNAAASNRAPSSSPASVPENAPVDAEKLNVAPPTEPTTRFDTSAPTDWRAALSGLKPGAPAKPADAARESTSNTDSPSPQSAAKVDAARVDAPKVEAPKVGAPKVEAPSVPAPTRSVAAQTASAGTSMFVLPAWLANLGLPAGISANPPAESATSEIANAASSLTELAASIAVCRACALGALAINPVPGEGNPDADFVCVGEAPGQTEDETGRPFVGAAGQLLTKILGAIQLQREDVFICNVLKHRPPGNRNPAPDEIHACTPYLTRQLSLVKPKVILALGTFAAQTLLNTTTSLGKLRGQVHQYQGVPLIVTYHPAALLRNEAWKRPTWDDVKLARRVLDAARQNDSASRS